MLHAFTRDQQRLHECALNAPDVLWIDLVTPTPEEIASVETALGIELPTRAEAEEIELSSRLYAEDDAIFMTVLALAGLDTDRPQKTPVSFILKGTSLVTVRYAESKPFQAYHHRAAKARGLAAASGEQVMLGLLEAMIDRIADTLERVGTETDGISREIFKQSNERVNKKTRNLGNTLTEIGHKAELLTMLQECLVSITRLVAYRSATLPPKGQARDVRESMRLVQRDAGQLAEHARSLSTRLGFLQDATLGVINLEQNQIIKIFSVAAVVFLPPTLVASIYGMNFALMPELNWSFGYPLALALMVVSALLPYLYFRRKGWL